MAVQAIETPAPRRGRPPKVGPEAILEVVDRKRDGSWTMASIAAELGVSEPAIYYHFPSKHALLVALGARVIEQLPLPTPTEDWEAWLTEFALAARDFCRQHPFLADVDMAAIAAHQAAGVRVADEMLRYLCAVGFSLSDATLALVTVMAMVQQFAFAGDFEDQREQLTTLATESQATVAAGAYRDTELTVDEIFRRMIRVIVAGLRTECRPTARRRKGHQ